MLRNEASAEFADRAAPFLTDADPLVRTAALALQVHAGPVDRVLRGGKWGFMLSVFGVAVAAAVEEFQALGYDEKEIAGNSPRKPAFAMKLIGAGTVSGALLGGALWRYRHWISIPLR